MTQPIRAAGSSPDAVARPEGTFRAYAIGVALAALFAACNVYLGLKLGLIANLSIPATLLAFGAIRTARVATGGAIRDLGILENNIVQAAASAGGSVAAAGLVSAVPAMMIVADTHFSWPALTLWISLVSALGVSVAMLIRRPMIEAEDLPFAPGVACATTLQQLHADRGDGTRQSALLIAALLASTALTWWTHDAAGGYQRKPIPLEFPIMGISAAALGWKMAFSPLPFAIGGLVGLRVGLSLLAGAIIAHGVASPWVQSRKIVAAQDVGNWLSWPGCTILILGTLLGLFIARAALWRSFAGLGAKTSQDGSPLLLIAALPAILAAALAVGIQIMCFGINPILATLAAALALPLAIVAARVAGEVSITPSGAMAKLGQIAIGAAPHASMQAGLLAANLAGGAASQCADLMHDLKCGAILGASWRRQALSQFLGAAVGAAAGAALLLWRFPDPARSLMTDEFSAPAVKPVKVLAEVLAKGDAVIPAAAWPAIEFAAVGTLLLLAIESLFSGRWRNFVPSAVSLGFAFLLSPATSISIAIGAIAATILSTVLPRIRSGVIITCTGVIIGSVLFDIGYDAFVLIR